MEARRGDCDTCTGKKKKPTHEIGRRTFSLVSWAKSLFSPTTDRLLAEQRLSICRACMERELDDNGKQTQVRLFRSLPRDMPRDKATPYCGAPASAISLRDEVKMGCGCSLKEKVTYENAQCPRGKWGPGIRIGDMTLKLEDIRKKIVILNGVTDLHVQCKAKPHDCNGIGDLFTAAQIAKGLREKYPDRRTRLITVKGNLDWAKMVYDDIDTEDSGTRGEYHLWSVPQSWILQDVTALATNRNRIEQLSMTVGSYPRDVRVKHNSDDLIWAQKEFHEPLIERQPIIALAPFANSVQRSWPLTRWLELMQLLKDEGYFPYVLDKPPQERTALFTCMRYWGQSPSRVAALLKFTDVLVSNDSGLAHLMGVMKRKCVAICAPTKGDMIFNHLPSVRVEQADGPCTGCLWQPDRGFRIPCVPDCELMWLTPARRILRAVVEEVKGGEA